MDERWDADIETVPVGGGQFAAVLVLAPPAELGSPVRVRIAGVYGSPEVAEMAALDAFAAMSWEAGQRRAWPSNRMGA